MGVSPIVANSNQNLVPLAWDMDKSGNLIAVVSQSKGGSQKDGIFIYSISGPKGATTEVTRNMPDSERVPNVDGYFSIFWL